VDATRARLFLYERSAQPEGLIEHFVERIDLVNPIGHRRRSESFSEDHVFAVEIGDEIAALVRDTGAVRLVVCASTRMLDKVRGALADLPRSVRVDYIPRDLVKLPPSQLRDQLASYTLLPQR
jgi:hypothetical protein